MYAVERHEWLISRARARGHVEVAATCTELEVAPETVRRDLNALERQGLLRRVHGGAVPVERLGFEGQLQRRVETNRDEKARVAAAGRRLLHNAESVYLDEGSTIQILADSLAPTRPLTVVTNALPVATLLADRANVSVLLLGGRVRGRTLATLEHWAVRMLADLVIDLAFLGTNGVSVAHGLTCPDPAVAAVKAAACAAARRRVLLCDHTKLGVDSFCRFADLKDLEAVVCDRGAPAARVRELHDAGVGVMLA